MSSVTLAWGENIIMSGTDFGMPYHKSKEALVSLYAEVYSAFGLKAPERLTNFEHIPFRVSADFFGNLFSFEIHGKQLDAAQFTHGEASVFHRVASALPLGRHRAWAYDISRLHEGILVGQAVNSRSPYFVQSEEQIKLLHLVGTDMNLRFLAVPQIEVTFGSVWESHGVPDRVKVTVESETPLVDGILHSALDVISLHYAPITGTSLAHSGRWNVTQGWLELEVRDAGPSIQPLPAEMLPF